MNKLEETMSHILTNYGHDVLVVHVNSKEKCSCYDPATGSPNTRVITNADGKKVRKPIPKAQQPCPYCFGTGTVPQIKKYRTRYKDARIPQSNAFMEQLMPFGGISVDAKVYYFDKHVKITEKDLIVEVDWKGDRPIYNGGGIFEVAHVDPLRYIGGEINHYRVYTKGKPINKSIRAIRIVKRANEIYYELAEKGGHQVVDPNPKQDPSDRFNLGKEEI